VDELPHVMSVLQEFLIEGLKRVQIVQINADGIKPAQTEDADPGVATSDFPVRIQGISGKNHLWQKC
jgi:hypothetical protein